MVVIPLASALGEFRLRVGASGEAADPPEAEAGQGQPEGAGFQFPRDQGRATAISSATPASPRVVVLLTSTARDR